MTRICPFWWIVIRWNLFAESQRRFLVNLETKSSSFIYFAFWSILRWQFKNFRHLELQDKSTHNAASKTLVIKCPMPHTAQKLRNDYKLFKMLFGSDYPIRALS